MYMNYCTINYESYKWRPLYMVTLLKTNSILVLPVSID